MRSKTRFCPIVLVAVLTFVRSGVAQIDDSAVKNAIRGGVSYIAKNQAASGSWTDHPGQPGGLTALCTLALLNAGEDVRSPVIQKALNYLRALGEPEKVYSTSLQTMVFSVAEPDKDAALIRRNVNWLELAQIKSGRRKGAWAYSTRGDGDNSNAQFALLALHEAERAGVRVSASTWTMAYDYWISVQREDGAWGYYAGEPPTGSMTCAGLASLVIASGRVASGDASVEGGTVRCCGVQTDNEPIKRAVQWLGSHFSVERNPNPFSSLRSNLNKAWLFYYLYGVERVGRLTGERFLGRHDWFREGAEYLISRQDRFSSYWRGDFHAEQNGLVATSFALLFLSKGRRPVVISKLKHGDGGDWNHHRSSVRNLTRRIERRWKMDLTWQTIDARVATLESLLETPVLFVSGRDGLRLTHEQKEMLREYVNQGGFIFAEACCGGAGFDRDFRSLMVEIFPNSKLRLLPPEHSVWFAEERVDPNYIRPLYGIDACCRTSVVYCPQDLSCYWELSRSRQIESYPQPIQDEIEACLRTGENVITYATNRELKNKLDRPQFVRNREAGVQPERGVLYVPKLLYSGGGDDAPNALPNLLNFVRTQTRMRVAVDNRLITATDPSLFEYPVVFVHGRRSFRFTANERRAIAEFVERGGMIVGDAICASSEFATSFRREINAIFAGRSLTRIPPEHPLFTSEFRGYQLSSVTLRDPQLRSEGDPLKANLTKISPLLEGLEIDDRIAVILSPYDLSCALENSTSLECKGYIKEDAAKIGVNIILFALQQ